MLLSQMIEHEWFEGNLSEMALRQIRTGQFCQLFRFRLAYISYTSQKKEVMGLSKIS